MNLTVKIKNVAGVPGGKVVLLCDENGEPLPGIISTVTSSGVEELSFAIDGDNIRFISA